MVMVEGNIKGKRRPSSTLEVVVLKDVDFLNIMEHIALNRAQWKSWIHAADVNWLQLKALFGLIWLLFDCTQFSFHVFTITNFLAIL